MDKKKTIVLLLIGLLVGFAMGASFIFWKQTILKEMSLASRIKSYVSSFFNRDTNVDEMALLMEAIEGDKSEKKPQTKKNEKAIPSDDFLNELDTLAYFDEAYDSLMFDTLYFGDSSYDMGGTESFYEDNSEIVVMRDRLLFTKEIQVLAAKSNDDNKSNLDSLLIGGRQPKVKTDKYIIEFWESPLNYRGYKRNKNKIVLYGVKQYDIMSLKMFNNTLYMKYFEDYFLLENTPHFQNLIPLKDAKLINQLKQL